MIVINVVITLLIVALIAFAVNCYFDYRLENERGKISIKESIDLLQIPVITLKNGDTKLNFVLDSGSSNSHICSHMAQYIIGTPKDTDYNFCSCGSEGQLSKVINTVLTYKDKDFNVSLFVNDSLNDAFTTVKNENGIQLHGLLGSDFLTEHKYILDFAELTLYHK